MENTDLNSWDNFTGSNFLKAEDVKDIEKEYICKGVEMDKENNRPLLILECEGVSSKFGLNVTNSNFLKNEGVNSPVEVVGRIVKFNIVKAFSPTAKKEVDSLRIRSLK